MWREHEDTGIVPRHFFRLCYESHDVISTECDGPDWTGGSLFEWFLSDAEGRFTLKYRRVEDWLLTLIADLRNGDFRRVSAHHQGPDAAFRFDRRSTALLVIQEVDHASVRAAQVRGRRP